MPRRASFFRRAVMAPLRRVFAEWLLLRGAFERAEAVLRIAARESPRSFRTHLVWGRVLLALGRDAEAKQVFRRCYQLGGVRFLDQDLPARYRELIALECDITGAAASKALEIDVGVGAEAGVSTAFQDDDRDLAPPRSDFVDGAEFRRFQLLEPLANTDPAEVDWDLLMRKLTSSSQSGDAGRT